MSASQPSPSPSPASALDDSYIDDKGKSKASPNPYIEGDDDTEMDDPTPMPSPVGDAFPASSKAPCASQKISTRARLSASPYPPTKVSRESKESRCDPLKIRIPRNNHTATRTTSETGPSYASVLSTPAPTPPHGVEPSAVNNPPTQLQAQPATVVAAAPMAGHGEATAAAAPVTSHSETTATIPVPNIGNTPAPTTLPATTHDVIMDNDDGAMSPIMDDEVFLPPGLHLMPVPEGGYPAVHGLDSIEVWTHVMPACRQLWESAPGNKVLAYLANDRPVINTSERIERITSTLSAIFPDTPFRVGCARLTQHRVEHKPIFPYLIAGLSDQQAHTLLSRRVWSTKITTLFIIPFVPVPSTYALTLEGIFLPPAGDNEAEVTEAVTNTLRSNIHANNFIAVNNDNVDQTLTEDEKINFVLNSVWTRRKVLFFKGRRCAMYFIYIHPPTTKPSLHRKWLGILRRLSFTTLCGQGQHTNDGWRCNLCKGLDHPTSMCRYPTLSGWNLPPHFTDEGGDNGDDTTNTATSSTPNARGRGSNRRGTPNRRGNARRG
ncbi:hypothetical protein JOM56_007020 [Amanita muscaria]